MQAVDADRVLTAPYLKWLFLWCSLNTKRVARLTRTRIESLSRASVHQPVVARSKPNPEQRVWAQQNAGSNSRPGAAAEAAEAIAKIGRVVGSYTLRLRC